MHEMRSHSQASRALTATVTQGAKPGPDPAVTGAFVSAVDSSSISKCPFPFPSPFAVVS
jgi:hypothetical protein